MHCTTYQRYTNTIGWLGRSKRNHREVTYSIVQNVGKVTVAVLVDEGGERKSVRLNAAVECVVARVDAADTTPPQLATPLPRAIRSSATRRVGGAHAPAAQACYGIGRQGCNTLVYVRARLEGDPTLRRLRLGRPRHHRREHVRVVRSPRKTHSCGNARNKTHTKG